MGNIPWRKERQPSPVFLPRESHGWRSLTGYSPWDHTELDMTKGHRGARVIPPWMPDTTWGLQPVSALVTRLVWRGITAHRFPAASVPIPQPGQSLCSTQNLRGARGFLFSSSVLPQVFWCFNNLFVEKATLLCEGWCLGLSTRFTWADLHRTFQSGVCLVW